MVGGAAAAAPGYVKGVVMSASSDDDRDPVLRKYAPKWSRERPAATDDERQHYVNLPKRGPGLRVSRRLCGRQRVDRRFATKWPTA
jgi:hypothetical protein